MHLHRNLQLRRRPLHFLIGPLLLVLVGCSQPAVTPRPAAQATFPAVGPAGVPPVVGPGALALIPADSAGTVVQVAADLGAGWQAIALVPADSTERLALRLQAIPSGAVAGPERLGDGPTLAIEVELYSAPENGGPATRLVRSLALALRPPGATVPSSLGAEQLGGDGQAGRRLSVAAIPGERMLRVDLTSPATVLLTSQTAAVGDRPPARLQLPAAATALPRAPLPVRLLVPSIGVDAPIVPLGLTQDGIMATPSEGRLVGWYELGPRPGEPSNAVLAGHVDWEKQLAVFFRLHELRNSAEVEVVSSLGHHFRYRVESMQSYTAEAAPVQEIFGPTAGPTLTLITCSGEFDPTSRQYRDRLVVRARAA